MTTIAQEQIKVEILNHAEEVCKTAYDVNKCVYRIVNKLVGTNVDKSEKLGVPETLTIHDLLAKTNSVLNNIKDLVQRL